MSARTALPCDARSVAVARHFVTAQLDSWGIESDCSYGAELMVSELVSNAVLHARTDVEILVDRVADGVRIGVIDRSRRALLRKRHSLGSATGRGLMLVDQLSSSWGVQNRRRGKLVWFEVHPGMAEPEPDLDALLSLELAL